MTTEFETPARRGATMLILGLVGAAALALCIFGIAIRIDNRGHVAPIFPIAIVACLLLLVADIIILTGLTIVAPNIAKVLVVFGTYKGTVKAPGFWWVNPFSKRTEISLRTRNKVTPTIKVNDIRGNPIEIGAVVVWRVADTARASFDVDDYSSFVDTQCESSLRHMASTYPYDPLTEGELSLRGSTNEVSLSLLKELQERVGKAGVVIEEARLSHLAYAAEIAGAMLRRQQADAIVSARFRIVEGAVGMVESALEHLEKSGKIHLDDERRAAMVSNLMVVLCGDHSVQPVVNAGTLHN
jgi:regulator of protease activity HflC (stomatin/prohibitin superfamily)